ncbi:hypothetical protein PM082_018911 [Marasmius tenuissimus]|nr:hypothetical protein PM082_018911 [Marasmius tenuissimus]
MILFCHLTLVPKHRLTSHGDPIAGTQTLSSQAPSNAQTLFRVQTVHLKNHLQTATSRVFYLLNCDHSLTYTTMSERAISKSFQTRCPSKSRVCQILVENKTFELGMTEICGVFRSPVSPVSRSPP